MAEDWTEGPWNRGYGNEVYQGEHYREGRARLVAICYPTNGTAEQHKEIFANARLIAAAPEMFRLLASIISRINYSSPETDEAFALLAKVRGREVKTPGSD